MYIGEELGEVLSLVEHEFKLDNIEVKHEIPYDIPAVRADRKQVQEILFNIIRNAAQSIEGSGTISVSARLSGKHVLVDISDTGAGINETDLVQIFNPFFTTKEPGKGTGLGLAVCKDIIEKYNGKITPEPRAGGGAIFSILLPLESCASLHPQGFASATSKITLPHAPAGPSRFAPPTKEEEQK